MGHTKTKTGEFGSFKEIIKSTETVPEKDLITDLLYKDLKQSTYRYLKNQTNM